MPLQHWTPGLGKWNGDFFSVESGGDTRDTPPKIEDGT